jgi:uncharacterized damage-inducible protein DinB
MRTNEIHPIADQLVRAHDGDPWYGDSTMSVLRGITAEQGSRRPIAQAHTVWELVLHITSWQREVVRRLRTGIVREPEHGDWPAVADTSDDAWRAALDDLVAAHRELLAEIERFPADALHTVLGGERDRPLGSGVTYYVLLHGVVQHNLAHTAQISLLKKSFAAS